MPCPLCAAAAVPLLEDPARGWRYASCPACGLAFRCDGALPDAREERRQYDLHENVPSDGYRAFLAPVAEAVAARCPAGAEGLDYGCGPGPVLALMLGEMGFKTALFDTHFAPSPLALSRRYAFVACTETAEHFRAPAEEFTRLAGLLEPGGWLAVMTRLRPQPAAFERWAYRLDPTHLCFYAEETFAWLARRFSWSLERPVPNVALFRAPGGHAAVAPS